MTAPTTASRSSARWRPPRRAPAPVAAVAPGTVPPLTPRLQLVRAALVVVVVLGVSLLLQLVVVSGVQQRATKERNFDRLRAELAEGTAPIGPTDDENRVLAPGTPVALLEIPDAGVSEVVVEGTSSGALFAGPGHRRDTPLPGQAGVSVVFGRRAAYGGPFAGIAGLEEGDLVRVTTGQGQFDFRVLGVRRAGDPVPPPPAAGTGRLLLVTATGTPYVPNGVVRVDAELTSAPVGGPARILAAGDLPADEQPLGADTSTLWALVLWLQVLIALAVGAVWAWYRWGAARTWVIFLPPLLLVGLATAGEVARLLPNLT